MPYNGSGTFALTTTFVVNTTIDQDAMNTLLADVGSGLTNSLCKDGQSSMTAAAKMFAGTVGAPGITFASDTTTGFYRIGSSNIGVSLGGTKYVDMSTSAFAIVNANATAFAVGRLGATTPAFTVDSSTASQVAGLKVTGAATGGTVAVVVTDSGADASLTINAKGSGTVAVTSVFKALSTLELGDASDTTLARASAGDISVEGNRIFRVGGTDVPIADGGTAASTASAARDNLGLTYAVQSDQETGTSTTTVVAPGTQHFHPGHPKFWVFSALSGGTPQLTASYNVTSLTDTGTGQLTVVIATDFSAGSYCTLVTAQDASNNTTTSVDNTSLAAGSVLVGSWAGGVHTDPKTWSVAGLGDQ